MNEIEVTIHGNSKIGFVAAFNYTGDDWRKDLAVMNHPANQSGVFFKTIKEIKQIADQISCEA